MFQVRRVRVGPDVVVERGRMFRTVEGGRREWRDANCRSGEGVDRLSWEECRSAIVGGTTSGGFVKAKDEWCPREGRTTSDGRERAVRGSNERGRPETGAGRRVGERTDGAAYRGEKEWGVGSPTPSFPVEELEWMGRPSIAGNDLSKELDVSRRIAYTSSNTR